MASSSLAAGRPAFEEDEEELSRCSEALCRWLQDSRCIPQESPAYTKRITAKCLINPTFMVEAIKWLCPSTHAQCSKRQETMSSTSSEIELAAACLHDGLQAVCEAGPGLGESCALALLNSAIAAGEAGFEPLGDIVWLWRHILFFAISSKSKEQHLKAIMEMAPESQEQLMVAITLMQQQLAPSMGQECSMRGESSAPVLGLCFKDAHDSTPLPGRRDSIASTGYAGEDCEREALVKENELLRVRIQQLSHQAVKDQQVIKRGDKILDGEFETFEQSWFLEKRFKEATERIRELEIEVMASNGLVDEKQRLVEEVEFARSQLVEHEQLKERFKHLRDKLEEIGDRKVEVQAWIDKHTEVSSERDALSSEVVQLRSSGNQLDAYRQKVQELERCRNQEEAKVKTAETRTKAAEAEQARVTGELAILEDKLQASVLELAALREGGGRACSVGIVEPFTDELRDRMRTLEARNEVLESQLTVEGAERVAQLQVEIETVSDCKVYFEERYTEATAALEIAEASLVERSASLTERQEQMEEQERRAEEAEEKLQSATEDSQEKSDELQLQRCTISELHGEIGKVTEEVDALQATKEQLEEERDDLQLENESMERRIEELQSQVEVLQVADAEAREEVGSLRSCQEHLMAKHEALQTEHKQLHEELYVHAAQHSASEAEARAVAEEEVRRLRQDYNKLTSQLHISRHEAEQAVRCSTSLTEREDDSEQQIMLLTKGYEKLRHEFKEEAQCHTSLRHNLELEVCKGQQLEELLERLAPQDFHSWKASTSSSKCGREARRCPQRPWAPENEAAQLLIRNVRLEATVTELRLRVTDLTSENAQASTSLRKAQRAATVSGQAASCSSSEMWEPLAVVDELPEFEAEEEEEQDKAAPAMASVERLPLQELPLEQFQELPEDSKPSSSSAACASSSSGACASSGGNIEAKPATKVPMPRNSILKKPKMPELLPSVSEEEDVKENCRPADIMTVTERPAQKKELSKALADAEKKELSKAKRVGLIGGRRAF